MNLLKSTAIILAMFSHPSFSAVIIDIDDIGLNKVQMTISGSITQRGINGSSGGFSFRHLSTPGSTNLFPTPNFIDITTFVSNNIVAENVQNSSSLNETIDRLHFSSRIDTLVDGSSFLNQGLFIDFSGQYSFQQDVERTITINGSAIFEADFSLFTLGTLTETSNDVFYHSSARPVPVGSSDSTFTFNVNEFSTTSVPEPATLTLLSLGLAGFSFSRKKRKT